MKTLKDLLADLKSDDKLIEKINDALKARPDDEIKKDPNGAFIATAAEFGYEVKPEELEELQMAQKEVLTEEELGKVAGGTIPVIMSIMSGAATVSLIVSLVDYTIEHEKYN